jgi:hypothetical protein
MTFLLIKSLLVSPSHNHPAKLRRYGTRCGKTHPQKPETLDERVTKLERLLAELVIAVTSVNEGAVREFQWMQDAFTQHEMEVRNGFADTRELLSHVNDRIVELRETLMAKLEKRGS